MSFRAAGLFSVLALIAMVFFVCGLDGCKGARVPREEARSVVLTVAFGVRQADLECAAVARAQKDLGLAELCATLVHEAREQLLTAEEGVDAFDDFAAARLPCALKSAADALGRLLATVQRAGGKTPPAVDDALHLAPVLAGACHE